MTAAAVWVAFMGQADGGLGGASSECPPSLDYHKLVGQNIQDPSLTCQWRHIPQWDSVEVTCFQDGISSATVTSRVSPGGYPASRIGDMMNCLVAQRNDSLGVFISSRRWRTSLGPHCGVESSTCHIMRAAGNRKRIRATVCRRSVQKYPWAPRLG